MPVAPAALGRRGPSLSRRSRQRDARCLVGAVRRPLRLRCPPDRLVPPARPLAAPRSIPPRRRSTRVPPSPTPPPIAGSSLRAHLVPSRRVATTRAHFSRRCFHRQICFDESDEKRRGFAPPAPAGTVEYEIGPEESVSTAVVRATSAVEGRESRALRSLATVVDPTALDSLFDPRDDGTPRTGGRISFVYDGCFVTIDSGEYLTLRPLEDRARRERDRAPSDGCVHRRSG